MSCRCGPNQVFGRALLLRGAGGGGSELAKDKCFVQVLELDPFRLAALLCPAVCAAFSRTLERANELLNTGLQPLI